MANNPARKAMVETQRLPFYPHLLYSTTAFISANWWWLNSRFVLFGKES
jgi:hypothetical protein